MPSAEPSRRSPPSRSSTFHWLASSKFLAACGGKELQSGKELDQHGWLVNKCTIPEHLVRHLLHVESVH